MTNLYNKGKYRGGEWAKHLRPYLKRVGNKRWRKTVNDLRDVDYTTLDFDSVDMRPKQRRTKKIIEVKFKVRQIGDKTYSYLAKYRSMRAAQDAMKRRNVLDARIID